MYGCYAGAWQEDRSSRWLHGVSKFVTGPDDGRHVQQHVLERDVALSQHSRGATPRLAKEQRG